MIADASNQEIDRLNARAQHLRAERGELGHREVPLPGVHYGLREGDRVAFIAQHRPPGIERVENGTPRRDHSTSPQPASVTIELDGTGRQRTARRRGPRAAAARLRPAHPPRSRARPSTRTLVVTGGWQTSKETAYVEASPAPANGTDWFVARDDLGDEGHDTDRIHASPRACAAATRRHHRSRTPSCQTASYGPGLHLPIAPSRTSPIPGIVREAINRIINPPAPERTR